MSGGASGTGAGEPPQLSKVFGALPASEHPKQWDTLYRDSVHPWDRDGPSLALADLLLQRPDLFPSSQGLDGNSSGRTALIPGCGLGHDALLLASFGYTVWGLDVSPTAIEKAKEHEKKALEKGWYRCQEGIERGSVNWLVADFFSNDWAEGQGTDNSGKFDLIFDYTFLCALPTELRPQWSQRICDLIHHKGRLVCLEFPSGKPISEGGPPFGVNPELYEALLSCPGEPIEYDPSGSGAINSTPSPKPRDNAVHRLSLIKPSRTHQAGTNEDGSVRDFISVWSV